jgi:hypothetical protein
MRQHILIRTASVFKCISKDWHTVKGTVVVDGVRKRNNVGA